MGQNLLVRRMAMASFWLRRWLFGGVGGWGLAMLAVPARADTIYVANNSDGTIIRIPEQGTASTFATKLGTPYAMVYFNGNLYLGDDHNTIYKVSRAGAASPLAKITDGGNIRGMAVDSQGNLYVTEGNSDKILKVSSTGKISVSASGLTRPLGVAVDKMGNVYYSTTQADDSISKITPDGKRSIFATGFDFAESMIFDREGNLIVADLTRDQVTKITPAGKGALLAMIPSPRFMALDAEGNILITTRDNGHYYKISPTGKLTEVPVTLANPYGIVDVPTEPPVAAEKNLADATPDALLILLLATPAALFFLGLIIWLARGRRKKKPNEELWPGKDDVRRSTPGPGPVR